MLTRRFFLLGTVATVAVAKASLIKATILPDEIIPIPNPLLIDGRKIYDLMFSSMTVPDEVVIRDAIEYTFMIDDRPRISMAVDRRSTFRWVAYPDGELIVPRGSTFRMQVEPCGSLTHLTMFTEDFEGIKYSEVYKWKDNKVVYSEVNTLFPQDSEEEDDDVAEC